MKYRNLKSPIHKIDPRTKVIYLFFILALAIVYKNLFTLSCLFLFSVLVFRASRLSFRKFLQETMLLQAFLSFLFLFHLYRTGFAYALESVLFLLDIFLLVAAFIQTTNPSRLSNSLVNWKLPYEFAFLFSLTLRFVPILQNELEEVKTAQASRAHRLRYPWDAIPILVPLLHKTFKRAFELSIALESKAFSGKRTFLREIAFGPADYSLITILALFSIAWLFQAKPL